MIAFVLLLALAAGADQGYDALLEDAVRARGEGRLQDSLDLLRRANAIQTSPGLRNNIARVLEGLGRWSEAVAAYRSVAADPGADPQLRALDDQRIAELAPKLLSAWISFDIAPESARVFLDGRPIAPQGGKDESATPGARVVESKLEREVVLETIDAPAGKRTTIKRDVSAPQRDETRLALDKARALLEGVTIDRYRLRSPIEDVSIVRLRAGRHAIELDLKGAATASATIDLHAGSTFDASLIIDPNTPIATAPASKKWPYVAGGGGVVAGVVGGLLLTMADSSRDEIRNAAVCDDGVRICGISRTRAEEIESSARTKDTIGVALIAAGTAAIAGGVAGWLLD